MENLVAEVCGFCHVYGKTNLIKATLSQGDVDINFPVVISHDYASAESKFVAVIQVPGLALIQRKSEPDLGFYEKVMASSVSSSWPVFAISGVMTLLAGLLIWVLVSFYFLCLFIFFYWMDKVKLIKYYVYEEH